MILPGSVVTFGARSRGSERNSDWMESSFLVISVLSDFN
jgi:hypothetical protein